MLKELTEKIRKSIPRLMELEDGCIIEYDDDKYIIGKDCEKELSGQIYLFKQDLVIFSDEYDIVGQEPMLNDVLEWLALKINRSTISVTEDTIHSVCVNNLLLIYKNYQDTMRNENLCIWNLSKPYLKDQSKESIENLNNL